MIASFITTARKRTVGERSTNAKRRSPMGVTSSGLLDEERDDATGTGSATEIASPDSTLQESGEYNSMASDILGHAVAGTPQVNYRGPCIYALP